MIAAYFKAALSEIKGPFWNVMCVLMLFFYSWLMLVGEHNLTWLSFAYVVKCFSYMMLATCSIVAYDFVFPGYDYC